MRVRGIEDSLIQSSIFLFHPIFVFLNDTRLEAMKTGEKIRLIREIKQISAKQMADDLDMSLSGYHKIERGDVKLTTEKLETIAGVLGVEAKNLLDSCNITFNIENNHGGNGHNVTNNYDHKLSQLQEDKIKFLEEKVKWLEDKIKSIDGK